MILLCIAEHFCCEIYLVQIWFVQTLPFDVYETLISKFFDVAVRGLSSNTHVFSQTVLAWEAKIIVPCVGQQQCVGELCSRRNLWGTQNRVGHLGKSTLGKSISSNELNVLFH